MVASNAAKVNARPCRRMARWNLDPANRVSPTRRNGHAGRMRIHESGATSPGAGISRTTVPVLQCHDVGDQTGRRGRPPTQPVRLQLPPLRSDVAARTASSHGRGGALTGLRRQAAGQSATSYAGKERCRPAHRNSFCGIAKAFVLVGNGIADIGFTARVAFHVTLLGSRAKSARRPSGLRTGKRFVAGNATSLRHVRANGPLPVTL